jgi:hypothetical protein
MATLHAGRRVIALSRVVERSFTATRGERQGETIRRHELIVDEIGIALRFAIATVTKGPRQRRRRSRGGAHLIRAPEPRGPVRQGEAGRSSGVLRTSSGAWASRNDDASVAETLLARDPEQNEQLVRVGIHLNVQVDLIVVQVREAKRVTDDCSRSRGTRAESDE